MPDNRSRLSASRSNAAEPGEHNEGDPRTVSKLGAIEYKYIVAIVAVFGLFMELLDATVVNVAIPTLARDFRASTTTIEWVITGYLLSLAVFIPVSGWAGDRFGTKRTFIFALTVFTGSSLACAFAWNVESLIAFRIVQGVGGGMLTPVGTAMTFRAFPPAERSKASGLMVIPTAVAPASGPVLGGFLTQYVSWEWIFLVNVPIGILGLIVSVLFLEEHREEKPGRFDPAGFVLAASGMAAVLYALAEAGGRGFDDARVLLFGISGLGLLTAFTLVELRTAEPMIDVRLFTHRLFRACNSAQFVAMTGFAGSLFILPIMLQAERGLNPFESGLATFPMAIGVMVMARPASSVYRIVGPRRMIATGLVISSLTSFVFLWVDLETPLWYIRGIMLVRGFGFGLMLVPLQAATFTSVAPSEMGRAGAVYNVGRQVAQSLGVAIVATVLTNRLIHHHAILGSPGTRGGALDAFRDGFVVAGVLTLFGVAAALLIRDSDAAPSMRSQLRVSEGEGRAASAAH